ncbi:hypothetical protein CONPUDRAFT_73206 [Coniophora puteana RWD-64-598 SS2]|uniref:Uncharacterized protein n=1 Tax=Coniophora puteana (strain RWD-64-598) TaxID=741705 RepID=A0A5M3MR02_CONPW|nr:uncharacterized protein CONPUDRAFT_73206 [Coniophora puteana RWD-64-598 SS2]EIW81487.1 hypothetical protein CONPUDRAFT_73206 [Coniophora puteana RWD-64-598 SS2]
MDRRFWSRIIIHVDAPYVTRHVINTFLAATRMRTIEIYVCYRGAPLMDPNLENRRILAAMECIRPHLSRCSKFTLKGLYRSSTVLASRLFDGVSAPKMDKLTSISAITDTDEPAQIIAFYCPKMSQLELDARSLADFVLAIDGRKDGASCSLSLVACRYRPPTIMDALSPKLFGDALIAAQGCPRENENADCKWDGSWLSVDGCPGFDDTFMNVLTQSRSVCPNLTDIQVGHSPCTPRALIQLAKARERLGKPLEALDVLGGIPLPSLAELTAIERRFDVIWWFEAWFELRGEEWVEANT